MFRIPMPMFLFDVPDIPGLSALTGAGPQRLLLIPRPKGRRGAVAQDRRRAAKLRARKRAKRLGHA